MNPQEHKQLAERSVFLDAYAKIKAQELEGCSQRHCVRFITSRLLNFLDESAPDLLEDFIKKESLTLTTNARESK